MNSPRPFFLLPWAAVVLLSSPACISVPDIEPAKAEVRITSPDGAAYTNGVLEIRLEVKGHAPERVELLKDGEVLAEVAAPYVYAWDTAGVAEGTHQLVARAVFGDVTFASEAREVVVDRTPPQVVSRTPEPGAQDVWVKAPIQAVFSEPVKAGTLTNDSVRLTVGGAEVARTVSVSADGRTVTVVPVVDVTPPKTAAVALSDAVTDLTGNTLAAPFTWSWFYPRLSLEPYGSSLPPAAGSRVLTISAMLPDGSGSVIVARTEQDSKGKHLRIYKQAGSEWFPLGDSLHSRGSNFEPDSVNLKLDTANNSPVIAWHEGNGSNEDERIYVARWTGSAWDYLGGTDGVTPSNSYSTFSTLALSNSGNVFVALTDDSESNAYIYQWSNNAWSMLGGDLGSALGLTQINTLSIETSTAGNPIVAVQSTKPGSQGLYIAEWTGSAWRPFGGGPEASSPPVDFDNQIAPHFQLDPQGSPTLAWLSISKSQGTRALAYTWDASQWKIRCEPFLVSAGQTASGGFQLGRNGTVWIGWTDPGTSTFRFVRCNDGTWSSFATSAVLGASFASASLHSFSTAYADPFFAAATLPDGASVLIRANAGP